MEQLPSHIGPYEIRELLGRGGMGVVYRAMQPETGEIVALKTVRMPQEGMMQGLRREIHTLARLHHPGIVRIVAEGVEQGIPWYAMELLEGSPLIEFATQLSPTDQFFAADVRAAASSSEDSSDAVTLDAPASNIGRPPQFQEICRLLTIVRRLCFALAYLHGEGLVHRDLKPGNILVQGQDRPVIMDFGLATDFFGPQGRETLEAGGMASGTASYMAPEQILGEFVDARTDLYALGCILYELVTGRRPFQGDNLNDLLRGHMEMKPAMPSSLNRAIPLGLNALILNLLSKRPEDRLGHATSVAKVLAMLGAADEPPPEPPPRAYLYRPRFAGRTEQLQALEERLQRLLAGEGGVVLLGGASGSGKTRLAMQLGLSASEHRVQVITGECLPTDAEQPLQAFLKPLEMLADRCQGLGLAEARRLLGSWSQWLQPYEPAFGAILGDDEADAEATHLELSSARLRLFHALAESLDALVKTGPRTNQPLLLLIDDLQWADELSLGALEYLLLNNRFKNSGILLVGTYRLEEVAGRFAELLESQNFPRILLGGLEEDAIRSIIQDMLALETAPSGLASLLTRQSAGNPFFVAESLRAAITEGVLQLDAQGRWRFAGHDISYEALPMPDSLSAVLRRRIESLSPNARRLVEIASAMGRRLVVSLLAESSGLRNEPLWEALAELLQHQVLAESEDGELGFVHNKLREAAYEQIPPARVSSLHRSIALAIEALAEGNLDEQAAHLGRHWELAGNRGRARDFYRRAADRARQAYALVEAEALYRAALRLFEGLEAASVEMRLDLARHVIFALGRTSEAIAEVRLALSGARTLRERSLEAQALLSLGELFHVTGRTQDSIASMAQALGRFQELNDRRGQAQVLGGLAQIQEQQGHLEEATNFLEEAIQIAPAAEEPALELTHRVRLAAIHYTRRNLPQALALFHEALPVSRKLGDRENEALILGNLASIAFSQGFFEEAASLYGQAVEIARKAGLRRVEGINLGLLAQVHEENGQIEEACQLLEQAILLSREVGNQRFEAIHRTTLSGLFLNQGRVQEAAELLEQALSALRRIGDGPWCAICLRGMAQLQRRCYGDLMAAARLLAEAESLTRLSQDPFELGMFLCERVHLALARGEPCDAFLEEAEQLVREHEIPPRSILRRVLAMAKRAKHSAHVGQTLLRGEWLPDIPKPLREWMERA